tara:strand:- start:677 stop:943 length:267 start_codon:yes stop_codon:yes gene_type:complete
MKTNLQKPSKVERARARLDGAVARLEAALESRTESATGEMPDPESTKKLEAELVALRGQNARLKAVNETVSGRLNGAIGRLKDVIGEA